MRRYGSLIKYTLLLLLLIYPFLFRRNFSALSHWYYDLVLVNPFILCYMLMIVVLVAVSAYVRGKLSLFSLIGIILIFSALEAITDYPMMVDIDVNLQGSSVNVVIEDGHLSEAWNPYHESYPGFFVLWASVSLVTGVDVRASNIIIMLPITLALLGLLLVLLYRRLGAEKGVSCTMALLAFLLMNFHINESVFLHFNTRLYALELIMLALLIFFVRGPRIWRKEQIVFLGVFYAVAISHILFPLTLLVFLFVYWLIEKRHDRSLLQTLFFCVIIYLTHNFTTGSRLFGYYVNKTLDFLHLGLAREMLTTMPLVTENVPVLTLALRTYYKILLVAIGLLAAYSLIKLRSKSGVRKMFCVLLASSIAFGATFFSASLGNSVVRGLMFSTVPLAFLALFAIIGRSKRVMQSQKLSLLTLLVSLLIIPQFVLTHETSFRVLNLQSLDAAAMFVTHTKNGQPIAAFGGVPTYLTFYDPKFWDYNMIGYLNETDPPLVRDLPDIADFFVQGGGIKFLAFRNVQEWAIATVPLRYVEKWGYNVSSFDEAYTMWTKEVFLPLESRCNKIYDNGFERIYR